MNALKLYDKNLETTLLGGQAFNWDLINNKYYGFFKDHVIKITKQGIKYHWQTFPNNNRLDLVTEYFDLENDYALHKINMQKDIHISKAINQIGDVRILNQDFEQTFLSFILTSHKNIKAVRKLIRALAKYYGTTIIVDNIEFKTFPTIENIANSSEKVLRELGCGFRANNFLEAAKRLVKLKEEDKDFNLTSQSENKLREFLTSFKGVGEKIADCTMVFALRQRSITPLDIWGKRVLTHIYKVDPKLNYGQMRNWLKDYFGENTAYAGQYLFEYLRTHWDEYSESSAK